MMQKVASVGQKNNLPKRTILKRFNHKTLLIFASLFEPKTIIFFPRARLNLAKSVNQKWNLRLAAKNRNDYNIVSLRDALQTECLLSISPSPHWELTNSVVVQNSFIKLIIKCKFKSMFTCTQCSSSPVKAPACGWASLQFSFHTGSLQLSCARPFRDRCQ